MLTCLFWTLFRELGIEAKCCNTNYFIYTVQLFGTSCRKMKQSKYNNPTMKWSYPSWKPLETGLDRQKDTYCWRTILPRILNEDAAHVAPSLFPWTSGSQVTVQAIIRVQWHVWAQQALPQTLRSLQQYQHWDRTWSNCRFISFNLIQFHSLLTWPKLDPNPSKPKIS